jgi:hypothetical protein
MLGPARDGRRRPAFGVLRVSSRRLHDALLARIGGRRARLARGCARARGRPPGYPSGRGAPLWAGLPLRREGEDGESRTQPAQVRGEAAPLTGECFCFPIAAEAPSDPRPAALPRLLCDHSVEAIVPPDPP